MGKLHTLRRAIERTPEKWDKAKGALRNHRTGIWFPSMSIWFMGGGSYLSFIRSVLRSINRAGRHVR